MTTATAVTSKLDAVNEMLASIGQSPINSLSGSIPKDAARAVTALDTCLRQFLTKGWSFNTDDNYTLTPDGSNNILVPAGAMHVDPIYETDDYVMRWDSGVAKLYDLEERTYTIDSPVDVKIIWSREFEEIPQHARSYVHMKAARKFQTQVVGSQILYAYTKEEEQEAQDVFKRIENRSKKRNMLRDNPTAWRHRNPIRY